jgi:hypothetical protein
MDSISAFLPELLPGDAVGYLGRNDLLDSGGSRGITLIDIGSASCEFPKILKKNRRYVEGDWGEGRGGGGSSPCSFASCFFVCSARKGAQDCVDLCTAPSWSRIEVNSVSYESLGLYSANVLLRLRLPHSHDGLLPRLLRALIPGGPLIIISSGEQNLVQELTLSGFVDVAASNGPVVTCRSPLWEAGDAAKLPFKPRAGAASTGTKSWLAAAASPASGPNSGGSLLVDEEALLESDLAAPAATSAVAAGGCATKRRACKDCTCGRKELEESNGAVLQQPASTSGKSSGCGNVSASACACCGTLYVFHAQPLYCMRSVPRVTRSVVQAAPS